MAELYTTAGSSTTVRVLSSTQVIDVQAIAIYTKPSQVYVVVQVPLADFQAGNSDTYLSTTADLIESLLNAPVNDISNVSYVSDTDASGLLAGFLAFTLSYTPPGVVSAPFETTLTFPVTSFESADAFDAPLPGGTVLAQINRAYAQLKALANA